ncbi:MAG: ABC transporter ATP-binding protein [Bacteriovoracaceae bacterium]|jgi:lipoprotein-releasing system ATP-binding protein|nr:ABC transporter ATP-binding protein [Bacteriovoracaceae bacterium]
MSLVKVENVYKSFNNAHALSGISLNLEANEKYVIQGTSGSGKSTLLYLIGGLDRPTKGSISIEDKSLADFDDESLALYRNIYVGFVFQFHFLLPSMNCLDNIFLPSKINGEKHPDLAKRVSDLAERLRITHCLKKYPFELSGGEQQRVNILRALSMKPKLLLCDEPTGNLDIENTNIVIKLLTELSNEFKSTLVVVTHNDKVASSFGKSFQIADGKLV